MTNNDTREVLINATEKIIAHHGFYALDAEKIAELAGLDPDDSVDNYFPNISDIISAIAEHRSNIINSERELILEGLKDTKFISVQQIYAALIMPFVNYMIDNPHSNYINFMYFCFQQGDQQAEIQDHMNMTSALSVYSALLANSDLEEDIINERIISIMSMIFGTLARWERQQLPAKVLLIKSNDLISTATAAFSAPKSKITYVENTFI